MKKIIWVLVVVAICIMGTGKIEARGSPTSQINTTTNFYTPTTMACPLLSQSGIIEGTSVVEAKNATIVCNFDMLTIPVETKKATGGVDNVVWPVNSDFGYSPNVAEKICQGPFMVLKKPLQDQSNV